MGSLVVTVAGGGIGSLTARRFSPADIHPPLFHSPLWFVAGTTGHSTERLLVSSCCTNTMPDIALSLCVSFLIIFNRSRVRVNLICPLPEDLLWELRYRPADPGRSRLTNITPRSIYPQEILNCSLNRRQFGLLCPYPKWRKVSFYAGIRATDRPALRLITVLRRASQPQFDFIRGTIIKKTRNVRIT